MQKRKTLTRIRQLGLLAVLRGPSADLTVDMVRALVDGGVHGIEITYSTPDAAAVVQRLAGEFGDQILLGMGTLTLPQQAAEARDAGALFLVSPHCEADLGQAMVATGLATMIGAMTPTEVQAAYRLGADIVKIFPGSFVGPGYLKSLRGPFPDIPLMPTGGVNPTNVKEWFSAGAVAVAAGSELCPGEWAKQGRFDDIRERAKEFCRAVEEARAGK